MLTWNWGKPLIRGFSNKPQKGYIEIEPDAGIPFRRMVFSDILDLATCSFSLTRQDYIYFMSWYKNELKQGTIPFKIYDCRYGVERVARLIGDVPQFQPDSKRYDLNVTIAFDSSVIEQEKYLLADNDLALLISIQAGGNFNPAIQNETLRTLQVGCLANNNEKLIALSFPHRSNYAKSFNGTNWTTGQNSNLSLIGSGYWNDVIFQNNNFIALSSNGYIGKSQDGENWNVSLIDELGNHNWYSLAFGQNKYIALALYGEISFSDNATNWSAYQTISNLTSNTWYAMTYGNNKFVALDVLGYISTSLNGIDWSTPVQSSQLAAVVNPSVASTRWCAITYGDGVFLASTPSGNISYSFDGLNWVEPIRLWEDSEVTCDLTYKNGVFWGVNRNGYLFSIEIFQIKPQNKYLVVNNKLYL